MMKRLFLILAASAALFSAQAQDKPTQERYRERYNNLCSNLGITGVGMETLLSRWENDYPQDSEMLSAKFVYYFTKSQSTKAIQLPQSKYLGQKPLLTLKDSLGNDINYFQDVTYDESLFKEGLSAMDKAIQIEPERLDFRFARVTALLSYEKESPDMAASDLRSIIDYNASRKPSWVYEKEKVSPEDFDSLIQEYCASLFQIGSAGCYEAFRSISEKMLSYNAKSTAALSNIGSYYLVAKNDDATALKYYSKVLKLKADDYNTLKNCVLIARRKKDLKLEKKYLAELIKYAPSDGEKLSAKARLDALGK